MDRSKIKVSTLIVFITALTNQCAIYASDTISPAQLNTDIPGRQISLVLVNNNTIAKDNKESIGGGSYVNLAKLTVGPDDNDAGFNSENMEEYSSLNSLENKVVSNGNRNSLATGTGDSEYSDFIKERRRTDSLRASQTWRTNSGRVLSQASGTKSIKGYSTKQINGKSNPSKTSKTRESGKTHVSKQRTESPTTPQPTTTSSTTTTTTSTTLFTLPESTTSLPESTTVKVEEFKEAEPETSAINQTSVVFSNSPSLIYRYKNQINLMKTHKKALATKSVKELENLDKRLLDSTKLTKQKQLPWLSGLLYSSRNYVLRMGREIKAQKTSLDRLIKESESFVQENLKNSTLAKEYRKYSSEEPTTQAPTTIQTLPTTTIRSYQEVKGAGIKGKWNNYGEKGTKSAKGKRDAPNEDVKLKNLKAKFDSKSKLLNLKKKNVTMIAIDSREIDLRKELIRSDALQRRIERSSKEILKVTEDIAHAYNLNLNSASSSSGDKLSIDITNGEFNDNNSKSNMNHNKLKSPVTWSTSSSLAGPTAITVMVPGST